MLKGRKKTKTKIKRKKERKGTKRNTKKTKTIIIQNATPKDDILLDKMIEEGIKQNVAESLNNQHYFNKMKHSRSYSPQINQLLVSISNSPARKFSLCDQDLLTINIGTEEKPNCVKYTNKKAREFFLKNLKNRDIDCSQVMAPKQIVANCWFNVFFVNFFISDKGRKFFKFFRQLMIEGKLSDGRQIPIDLAKAFFMINVAIEASHNHAFKNIAYLLNTNLLIIKIYNTINKINNKEKGVNKKQHKFRHIEKVGSSGNPLFYYLGIMNYLNINPINIILRHIYSNKQLEILNNFKLRSLVHKINKTNIDIESEKAKQEALATLPDMLVFEIAGNKHERIDKKQTEITIEIEGTQVIYTLDSIAIIDNDGKHFCSVITCNGDEFVFEGGSYNRFTPFKWKSLINKNKNWRFLSDKYDNLDFNFIKGYQMMFYYRVGFRPHT